MKKLCLLGVLNFKDKNKMFFPRARKICLTLMLSFTITTALVAHNVESALYGRWVTDTDSGMGFEWRFNNGSWETWGFGEGWEKGTYIAHNGIITITITHIWNLLGTGWLDEGGARHSLFFTNEHINARFASRTMAYSLACNTLIIDDEVFTRPNHLNGIWVRRDFFEREWMLGNRYWEMWGSGFERDRRIIPRNKGTYSVYDGIIIKIITHIYHQGSWLERLEYIEAMAELFSGNEYFEELINSYNSIFEPRTGRYSIMGDSLNVRWGDGPVFTYTRK